CEGHAPMDGLRDAPDGRALRQRRHGPASRRRRAPDRHPRAPPPHLPRVRRPGGVGEQAGGLTAPPLTRTTTMIYSTATVPVNPPGQTPLTRAQVWAGLELKARDARLFLPPGLCTRCEIVEESATHQ